MPSVQRGTIEKVNGNWRARWYDENGVRRAAGGFATKTSAADVLKRKLDEVEARRRGDLLRASHRPQTVDALVDTFLDRQLRHARTAFGDRHPTR